MAAASDRGSTLPARSPRTGAGFPLRYRSQVQRIPADTPVIKPWNGLLVQRFRPERGGQATATTHICGQKPSTLFCQPVLDARQQRLSRLVRRSAARGDHDGSTRSTDASQIRQEPPRRLPVTHCRSSTRACAPRPLLSRQVEHSPPTATRWGALVSAVVPASGRLEQLIDILKSRVGLGQAARGPAATATRGLGQAAHAKEKKPRQGFFPTPGAPSMLPAPGVPPPPRATPPHLGRVPFRRSGPTKTSTGAAVLARGPPPTLLVPSPYS